MMKYAILISFIFIYSKNHFAQTFRVSKHNVQYHGKLISSEIKDTYSAELYNIEAPKPDGDSYFAFINEVKKQVRKRFPLKPASKSQRNAQNSLIVGKNYRAARYSPSGIPTDIIGGIPNDNTLAISDSGIVLIGMNSNFHAYDLRKDTFVLTNQVVSLKALGGGSLTDYYYDPKLIYDPQFDRFIMVFLKNNQPSSNRYFICFSISNNPNDGWHIYSLPGNPLNNNRWTDFPCVSITHNEVFLTGNLIIPGVSWQVGFDGSIIWQVDKKAGYNGESILPNKLYSDIRFGGRFIRNLHAVQGSTGNLDEAYFLSNRNFDIQNDTVFVFKISGLMGDTTTNLEIKQTKTNLPYGVPPNGRQADTDINNPASGLQTNDARVLSAIWHNQSIHYVANTINPTTGFSAIYHGLIYDLNADKPKIKGNIIAHPQFDLGYPSIANLGKNDCDIQSVIAFNYTSPTDFPGFACVYYQPDSTYSDIKILKQGLNIADRLSGTSERWGDYFGLQKWFAKPNRAMVSGYYTLANKNNSTWVYEVISADTSEVIASVNFTGDANFCNARVEVVPQGGTPPYSILWSDGKTSFSRTGLCKDDSLNFQVFDSKICNVSQSIKVRSTVNYPAPFIYPNPATSRFVFQFELDDDYEIKADIIDLNGKLVAELLQRNAKKGLNELIFNIESLAEGVYFVRITESSRQLYLKKIVKHKN